MYLLYRYRINFMKTYLTVKLITCKTYCDIFSSVEKRFCSWKFLHCNINSFYICASPDCIFSFWATSLPLAFSSFNFAFIPVVFIQLSGSPLSK